MKTNNILLSTIIFLYTISASQPLSNHHHQCFTPKLTSTPLFQKIVKESGKRFSKGTPHADTVRQRSFFVRNTLNQLVWDTVTATRIYSSNKYAIWIDTSIAYEKQNKQQHVYLTHAEQDSLIASFKHYLVDSTSFLSINPQKGIIDLEHEYFGLPPNVDGDGLFDILLLDINDGFPNTTSYIAGFFDPNDLYDTPNSNKKDLLYVDIYPLIKEGLRFSPEAALSTIAHEYQHLIHSHYEQFESEYVFINEGLSEFAETITGFVPRSGEKHAQNTERALLSWNFSDPLPDYSRASLWTEYLFEQLGYQHIKTLVQSPKVGMSAIDELLSISTNLSFSQVFANWTLANMFNDSSYSSLYSYRHPLRNEVYSYPKYSSDVIPTSNTVILQKNSCYIIQYTFVEDILLNPLHANSRVSFSALTKYPNASKIYHHLLAPTNLRVKATPQSNATIQIMIRNVQDNEYENDTTSILYSYMVIGKKSGKYVQVNYDDGIADPFINNSRYLLIERSEAIGVSFSHKKEAWLKDISVKGIFLSEVQGSGLPRGIQRDIEVQIYTIRNGLPDSMITPPKKVVFEHPEGILKYITIPLDEYYQSLATLKDTFCAVIRNDIDDSNYFAIGLDNSSITKSYLYDCEESSQTYKWKTFGQTKIEDSSLAHWNAMVRSNSVYQLNHLTETKINAAISVAISNASLIFRSPFPIDTSLSRCIIETPKNRYYSAIIGNANPVNIQFPYEDIGYYKIALALYSQNNDIVVDTLLSYYYTPEQPHEVGNIYPNPFNGSAKIPISVYASGNISLKLFNVLGQTIFFKDIGITTSGFYDIPLNLSQLSSSVYFVSIIYTDSNNKKKYITNRKIVLVK